jgi:hypothetical protein
VLVERHYSFALTCFVKRGHSCSSILTKITCAILGASYERTSCQPIISCVCYNVSMQANEFAKTIHLHADLKYHKLDLDTVYVPMVFMHMHALIDPHSV